MFTRFISRPGASRLAACAAVASLSLLPLVAHAEESLTNWPLPVMPHGGNSAAFGMPRNEWMQHFVHNLERTKQGNVDLVFDGDSITDGWQGTNGKEVWAKNYGQFHAADFGIGGDRTENILWRLDHGQVAGLHPRMVALMIGTNNMGVNTAEQIAEGITAIVREYQKLCPDAVILLQAIFPRGADNHEPLRPKIKATNAIIAKLGDGKKVIYMDFGDKFLQFDGSLPKDVMPDFLHPNAKGYEMWADAIRPEIERIFGPTPPSTPTPSPTASK